MQRFRRISEEPIFIIRDMKSEEKVSSPIIKTGDEKNQRVPEKKMKRPRSHTFSANLSPILFGRKKFELINPFIYLFLEKELKS